MSGTEGPRGDLDTICIGNAIVDVLAQCDDDTIDRLGMAKGAMTLIEAGEAQDLYEQMGPAVEASGGSAANTAVGVASLGGQAAFIGKVRTDQFGGVFTHDIRAVGVAFDTAPATDGPPTARSLIFITPDAQRTMNTYLGACVNLGPGDIEPELIARGRVTYMEGYLWDRPEAKAAFLKAAELAHKENRDVALTLSDPFCVERHRSSFLELIAGHIDVLFANEKELVSLYQARGFDEALQHARHDCRIAALTRSEKGSVVASGDEVHVVDAERVDEVKDTTGAGDQYAAGFLFGLTRGHDLAMCARLGGIAAAEVISHVGPRPRTSLAALVASKLRAG